ncbi:hypothetical protein R1flu_001934 [Riccia fluitans]|uniref:Uncharacterized protein n=1 Tax=Riccia fluitans TaxID=41844 RepID=A0ABD1Y5Q6_9MARC
MSSPSIEEYRRIRCTACRCGEPANYRSILFLQESVIPGSGALPESVEHLMKCDDAAQSGSFDYWNKCFNIIESGLLLKPPCHALVCRRSIMDQKLTKLEHTECSNSIAGMYKILSIFTSPSGSWKMTSPLPFTQYTRKDPHPREPMLRVLLQSCHLQDLCWNLLFWCQAEAFRKRGNRATSSKLFDDQRTFQDDERLLVILHLQRV